MNVRLNSGREYKPSFVAKKSNIPLLGRTVGMAVYQQKVSQLAAVSNWPNLSAFLPQNLWPWIWHYLKISFRRKVRPYPVNADAEQGIYPLRSSSGEAVSLCIAGDWGTGTYEAFKIAQAITEHAPDYSIHLGDVYYVGDDPEVKENFLGIKTSEYDPIAWPKGKVGTFTLLGNHEMYGGGKPYFSEMLAYCQTGGGGQQQSSFFCLEGEFWRIIAVDTGYNSVGIPILSGIPGIKNLPFVGANCKLESALTDWLGAITKLDSVPKATLLLSHHQFYSAFQDEFYPKPAKQLSELFTNQEVVWLFGHEHRLAIYDSIPIGNDFRAYARCVGHGGMPVDDGLPKKTEHLQLYDKRTDYRLGSDGSTAGWNGYVNATVQGTLLTLNYIDISGQLLLSESFDSASGPKALVYDRSFTSPILAAA